MADRMFNTQIIDLLLRPTVAGCSVGYYPTLRIQDNSIPINFCPFCGVNLHEEAKAASEPTSTG